MSIRFFLKERRRANRVRGRLPVLLVLRQGPHGELLAGSSPGEIVDVSFSGAGLLVDQIRIGSAHLFYTPQDNPSLVLHMEVELPSEGDNDSVGNLSIPVHPVRFDRVLEEENSNKPFLVGVEFLPESSDEQIRLLYQTVGNKHKNKGGAGWQSVVNLFRSIFGG